MRDFPKHAAILKRNFYEHIDEKDAWLSSQAEGRTLAEEFFANGQEFS